MDMLLPLAVKSLLVAGVTLALLRLMQKRSASDRSLVAHLGLGALLLLPVAALTLPALEVTGPDFITGGPVVAVAEPMTAPAVEAAPGAATFPAPVSVSAPNAIDWAFWAYALPAAVLGLLTLIALLRLIPLKARANVLVDAHWLSALARAQRRMGFKNGTALLTSEDIRSPISWGLMRPVILLNGAAAEAHDEAEAIIAHELAHVAGLDWAKLLLARVTVAMFWFNPLAWMLAREAHQLREEAADDAVLASDIEDTEYANLLVGIAKHECRGLLLGAHGVAPARNSLARRVKRVLDSASVRAPGGWKWSAAAAFFAAGMAVPVAALQIIEPTVADAREEGRIGALAASAQNPRLSSPAIDGGEIDRAIESAELAAQDGSRSGPTDAQRPLAGDRWAALDEAMVKMDRAFGKEKRRSLSDDAVDNAIAAKIHGVTPDYVRAIRATSPAFARMEIDDLVGFKVHRVTPEMIRELQRAGYANITPDDVENAAVHGIDGSYVRGMADAGYRRLPFEQLVEMKVMGVTPAYAKSLRRRGFTDLTAEQIIKMKMFGVDAEDVRSSGGGDP